MATLAEMREKARLNGTKQKTTKRREDGVGIVLKGIAKEPTTASRAELAQREGSAVTFSYDDGTKESAMHSGLHAAESVYDIYNETAPAPAAETPPAETPPTSEPSETPPTEANRVADHVGNGRARKAAK